MADIKMTEKQISQKFRQEIKIAEQVVSKMEDMFWETCRDFYVGNHKPSNWGNDDFITVNYIWSNIVSQMPRLSFTAPEYSALPSPVAQNADAQRLQTLKSRARDHAALLNQERQTQEFRKHLQVATIDSLVSMGVFKTFHQTEKRKNPRAGEVKFGADGEPLVNEDGDIIREPDMKPTRTTFKNHRVSPENFLVDPRVGNFLSEAQWVGEKILMDVERARKQFNDPRIAPVHQINEDIEGGEIDFNSPLRGIDVEGVNDEDLGMTVVYEVWWTRKEKRFYLVKGRENRVYKMKDIPPEYTKFPNKSPYVPLMYHVRPNKFHPIPDVWPQTQINLSYDLARTQLHNYRRQYQLKYLIQEGMIDEQEMEKFQSDEAGQFIFTQEDPRNMPIEEVAPPKVPGAVLETLGIDLQDLQKISGVTQEMQGAAQLGQKATQSILSNRAAQSKMAWKLMHIQRAMQKVGERMHELMKNRLERAVVVREGQTLDEMELREIDPSELGGMFDIDVKFGSTQPDDQPTQKRDFFEAIQLMSSFPQLLRHVDTRELIEEFTHHYPLTKSMIRPPGDVDMSAFEGAGRQNPNQQGSNGRAQAGGVSDLFDGLGMAQANARGGMN